MKKLILMSALFAGGIAFTSTDVFANSTAETPIVISQEKTQIEPDKLPDAVKQAIAADESLKGMMIAEAWQAPTPEGKLHYQVAFDNGTEEKLWKTYDADGKVVE